MRAAAYINHRHSRCFDFAGPPCPCGRIRALGNGRTIRPVDRHPPPPCRAARGDAIQRSSSGATRGPMMTPTRSRSPHWRTRRTLTGEFPALIGPYRSAGSELLPAGPEVMVPFPHFGAHMLRASVGIAASESIARSRPSRPPQSSVACGSLVVPQSSVPPKSSVARSRRLSQVQWAWLGALVVVGAMSVLFAAL